MQSLKLCLFGLLGWVGWVRDGGQGCFEVVRCVVNSIVSFHVLWLPDESGDSTDIWRLKRRFLKDREGNKVFFARRMVRLKKMKEVRVCVGCKFAHQKMWMVMLVNGIFASFDKIRCFCLKFDFVATERDVVCYGSIFRFAGFLYPDIMVCYLYPTMALFLLAWHHCLLPPVSYNDIVSFSLTSLSVPTCILQWHCFFYPDIIVCFHLYPTMTLFLLPWRHCYLYLQ